MLWRHETTNYLTMLYGFKSQRSSFDAIVTLYHEGSVVRCRGFLSKARLTLSDYNDLFKYVQKVVKTDLVFEVLESTARLYRRMFRNASYTIIDEKISTTFDGYKSLLLRVRLGDKK